MSAAASAPGNPGEPTVDVGTATKNPPASARARLEQLEGILGHLDTGVMILEPSEAGDPTSLEVVFVNETGAEFFEVNEQAAHLLTEAHH